MPISDLANAFVCDLVAYELFKGTHIQRDIFKGTIFKGTDKMQD